MVKGASECGCLKGLGLKRADSHAKNEPVEPHAASCHHEEAQAKIELVFEAKQQHENEAKSLLEFENEAKTRTTADAENLKHVEVGGQFEKATAEPETKQRLETSNEAAAPPKRADTSSEDMACLPLEGLNVSLISTQIESSSDDASYDGQDVVQDHDVPNIPQSSEQAMTSVPQLHTPRCGSVQRAMETATRGDGVLDSIKLVTEGQRALVAPQSKVHDGHQLSLQSHEEDPGSETASETASFKERYCNPPAPTDQLNLSEVVARRSRAKAVAEGGVVFARTAVLTGCVVVLAIAVHAFWAYHEK